MTVISGGTIVTKYDFASLNVMVVEDNGNMQKLLRAILNALGVRNVCTMGSGVEAFQELSRFEADIIICDWNMSPMNGLLFTKKVRTDPKSPNCYVPIIMLTGHTEVARVVAARDAGANMILAKPISVKTLAHRPCCPAGRRRDAASDDRRAGDHSQQRAEAGACRDRSAAADREGASAWPFPAAPAWLPARGSRSEPRPIRPAWRWLHSAFVLELDHLPAHPSRDRHKGREADAQP